LQTQGVRPKACDALPEPATRPGRAEPERRCMRVWWAMLGLNQRPLPCEVTIEQNSHLTSTTYALPFHAILPENDWNRRESNGVSHIQVTMPLSVRPVGETSSCGVHDLNRAVGPVAHPTSKPASQFRGCDLRIQIRATNGGGVAAAVAVCVDRECPLVKLAQPVHIV